MRLNSIRPVIAAAAAVVMGVMAVAGCQSEPATSISTPAPSSTSSNDPASASASAFVSTPTPVSAPAAAKLDPHSPGSAAATAEENAPPADLDKEKELHKPVEDWPVPIAGLFLTGQLDGHLEPCGCTDGQRGGLPRRYDLWRRLKDKGWNLGGLDLGGILRDASSARGGPVQAKIKLNHGLRALTKMDYAAIALNPEDLKLGIVEALADISNMEKAPKVLSSNIVAKGDNPFKDLIQPDLVIQAGKLKIGVAAVINPETWSKLTDPERDAYFEAKDPKVILASALKELEGKSDFQVLMVVGAPAFSQTLAEAHPGFDLVVSASQNPDPSDTDTVILNNGKTTIVQAGRKGTYAGVVGIYEQEPKVRFQRVTLDKKYDKNKDPIRELLDKDYLEQLKAMSVVETIVRRDALDAPIGATYVGAQVCAKCHAATAKNWSKTGHAHAFDSLLKDPKEPNRKSREFDAECISCHTTGFEHNSGWVSAEKTSHLKGNQCENCHGPGSKHAAEPDHPEFLTAIARDIEAMRKSHFCYKCHDEDNSPHFNFEKAWDKIKHSAMDDYSDPKVHQGIK